jgi:hypothetical protein
VPVVAGLPGDGFQGDVETAQHLEELGCLPAGGAGWRCLLLVGGAARGSCGSPGPGVAGRSPGLAQTGRGFRGRGAGRRL